jgi:hypothetical protein
MRFWNQIIRSNFFIKLRSWEYWPFGIVQFPVIIYWLWLAIRSRSLVFFSASNPGIVMGGMFGESKFEVIKKIPANLIPKTSIVRIPVITDVILQKLIEEGFSFPVIFKPDLGERGFMVRKISSPSDIDQYLKEIKLDFLIQELVDLPLEFGVFYSKFPDEKTGRVTSIVMKEMLTVTGDGKSTLKELILNKDRAKLQWEKLQVKFQDKLRTIIPQGETMELVSIGNHALGTKFLNGNYLINEKLCETFNRISDQIEGFYFGRFDIRCQTLEDFYNGKIKILELNGCGAEPAHIYDPKFSLIEGVKVLLKHWHSIFKISRQNHRKGVNYITHLEALKFYRKFKSATKS